MSNFKRNNFGGDRNFRKPNFGGGGYDKKQTFKAVCATCGKDCDLPFRPSGNRPVLCRECFAKERGQENGSYRSEGRSESRGYGDRNSRPSYGDRPQRTEFKPAAPAANYKQDFDALNAKLDKVLRVLNTAFPTPKKKEWKPDLEPQVKEVQEVVETLEAVQAPEMETVEVKKKKAAPKKKAAKLTN